MATAGHPEDETCDTVKLLPAETAGICVCTFFLQVAGLLALPSSFLLFCVYTCLHGTLLID
jgi:hypothetical protein